MPALYQRQRAEVGYLVGASGAQSSTIQTLQVTVLCVCSRPTHPLTVHAAARLHTGGQTWQGLQTAARGQTHSHLGQLGQQGGG